MKYKFAIIWFLISSTLCYGSLNFGTYNIRTFDYRNDYTNKIELKSIINKMDPDFLTVEEIINSTSFRHFIKKNFPDYSLYLNGCGGSGRQKIGFLYKKSLFNPIRFYEDYRLSSIPRSQVSFECGSLRSALVGIFEYKTTKKKFVAIGLHLKAGSNASSYERRARQYNILEKMVNEFEQKGYKNIVLMGDMNTTGFKLKDSDYSEFNKMVRGLGYETSSRNLECTSYWSGSDRYDNIEESSVLDHIIFSENFLGYKSTKTKLYSFCAAQKCEHMSANDLGIQYKEVSDHCPVSLTFK